METVRRNSFDTVEVITDGDADHYKAPPEGTVNVFILAGVPWLATFLCPCGCGELVLLSLLAADTPSWRIVGVEVKQVTLSPSIQRVVGCESHFYLERNTVRWC